MTAPSRRLRAVSSPPRSSACMVVCQASLTGQQEISVRVLMPVSGPPESRIAVRVGAVLLLISDQHALDSLAAAVEEAQRVAGAAHNQPRD